MACILEAAFQGDLDDRSVAAGLFQQFPGTLQSYLFCKLGRRISPVFPELSEQASSADLSYSDHGLNIDWSIPVGLNIFLDSSDSGRGSRQGLAQQQMGKVVPMTHQKFHDDHALDFSSSQIGEEGSTFVVVEGELENSSPQRFHRRLAIGVFVEYEISADVLPDKEAEIAHERVKFDTQDKLAVAGSEVEFERVPRVQNRRP